MCAFSAAVFTGCGNGYGNGDRDEKWPGKIYTYAYGLSINDSGMKNIGSAQGEAFESAFNDIEIFGARLCLPMRVSELPDKFELSSSGSEYVPLSENEPGGRELGAGLKKYPYLYLYYDREILAAEVSIICKEDQSIEEGIIYELEIGVTQVQPVLLGGQVEIRSDIDGITEFLGEGNGFYDLSSKFYELFYTDGNRIIELTYAIEGDEAVFLSGKIRTYNNYYY